MVGVVAKQVICVGIGATLCQILRWQKGNIDNLPPSLAAQDTRLRRRESNNTAEGAAVDEIPHRRQKLGDGCHHVFLDVGSNIGVHARMLFEPHLYPPSSSTKKKKNKNRGKNNNVTDGEGNTMSDVEGNSRLPNNSNNGFSSREYFVTQFGPERARDNTQICVFAFEPNPAHVERHRTMEAVYSAMGWRYHFIPAGVGDDDGELTFYHIGKGNKELERGFTTVKERCRRDCTEERVRVIRLSRWIDEEIEGRMTPSGDGGDEGNHVQPEQSSSSTKQSHASVPPRVVMKMDIEMAEWLVFPDLLASGTLCRTVDALLGEFHTRTHAADYPIRFPHRSNWTLETPDDAEELKELMFGVVRRNPICRTEIVEGDDESYGTDGMPWPVEPPVSVVGSLEM